MDIRILVKISYKIKVFDAKMPDSNVAFLSSILHKKFVLWHTFVLHLCALFYHKYNINHANSQFFYPCNRDMASTCALQFI